MTSHSRVGSAERLKDFTEVYIQYPCSESDTFGLANLANLLFNPKNTTNTLEP